MNAFTLVKNGKAKSAFELREKPTPKPGEGEVLIESEGFGLNFADVMARLGIYAECPPLPTVLGYENVGRIKEVGKGVTKFSVGDRVLAFTRFGGYSDHIVSPAIAVVKVSENLSVGEATALATQYVTAYFATEYSTTFFKGDHVLVHAAAGGVGTALIQLLKRKGCIIFGTAGSEEKLEYLKNIGVKYPINYRKENYVEAISRLGYRKKIDATFNPIGGNYVKKDLKLLGPGGRLILYGASKMTESRGNIFKMIGLLIGFGWWSPIPFVSNSKSMIGINMLRIADNRPDILEKCLSEVATLAENNEIQPFVGKEFTADQLSEAHEHLESRQSIGKLAVKWN